MKTLTIIAAVSLSCCVSFAAKAQPTPAEEIQINEFIGPFEPTPESRAEARKEALAAYAWFSRICSQTTKGKAMTKCLRQARQDRDNQLAYADNRRKWQRSPAA